MQACVLVIYVFEITTENLVENLCMKIEFKFLCLFSGK